MNAVFAIVILGAVAAASAAAVPPGTNGYQWPWERRARQVYGVKFGDGNFSPTVNMPSRENAPGNADSSSNPSRRVYGVSFGKGNFNPTVNIPSSYNTPENVASSNNPSVEVPSSVYGVKFGDGYFSPTLDVPSSENAPMNAASGNNPSVDAPSSVYGVYVGDGSFSPNVNVPSSENPSSYVAGRPFSAGNRRTCTMTCKPQQQLVNSTNRVIGVQFGDGSFSPTLNVPSGSYQSLTVGSCACNPIVNAMGTITCYPQQDQGKYSDRVVGVSFGDGNFSPTINIPRSRSFTVASFKCTCTCK